MENGLVIKYKATKEGIKYSVDGMPDKHIWDKLPSIGSIPFEPELDKAWRPIIKRGLNNGLVDKYGREWTLDKQVEKVGNGHWDIQLNNSDCEINHGEGKSKGKKKKK